MGCIRRYRILTNLQSRILEEVLAADKILTIVGGQAFFERKEVRDVIFTLPPSTIPLMKSRRIVNMPSRGLTPSLQRFAAFELLKNVDCTERCAEPVRF